MKKRLLTTAFAASLVNAVYGQAIIVGNTYNNSVDSAATSNGLVWTNNLGHMGLYDGFDYDLGITIYGGSSTTSLNLITTILPNPGSSQYTGFDYGTFLPTGLPFEFDVPNVAPGGMAWIKLELWAWQPAAGGGAGGPYTSFETAQAGGALWGEALFQNPTGSLVGSPPIPPQSLYRMPALTLAPEPSTLALGLLGLAALLVSHRRAEGKL